jgi:hypothetical protein
MPRFKIGVRVTHRDRPDERGTVVSVTEESADGTRYEIKWDGHTRGQLPEEALVPLGDAEQ